jgi:glucan endo-1,3-alpha-glucosidase
MSYTWAQSDMVSLVSSHANSSSAFKWDGKVLVSTYSGENLGETFWSGFKDALKKAGVDVVFAPAFTSYRDPAKAGGMLSDFPSMDGFFNWWSWCVSSFTFCNISLS